MNPGISLRSVQVGDTSLFSTPNLAFFQTFGLYMPYNPNLVLSLLLLTVQQSQGTPQRLVHLTPPPTEQRTHSRPTHQAPTNTANRGWQSVSSMQNDVPTTNKILLELEGNA